MGLLTAGASVLTVAGGVASSVLSLGAGAFKLGGKILSSTTGKLALGAGAIAVLCSDPKNGGFFGRLKESAGNFFKSIGAMVGKSAVDKTVEATAVLTGAGENVMSLTESVVEAESPSEAVQAIKDAGSAVVPDAVAGLCEKAELSPEMG